jgi:probable HAF family extracellular repeat protein
MFIRLSTVFGVLFALCLTTGVVSGASYTIAKCDEGICISINLGLGNAGGYALASRYDDDGSSHECLVHNGVCTDICTLGGSWCGPMYVNDHGQVVGASSLAGDTATHAFSWSNGAITDMGTLGGSYSGALRINNSGQVAGNSSIAGDQFTHGFVFKGGSMSDLGTLGGNTCIVADMSEIGQIIGASTLAGDDNSHAFLWSNGSMTDLGTLGDSYLSSEAMKINSSGQVVGNCSTKKIVVPGLAWDREFCCYRPFLYSGGTMTDINDLVDDPHLPFQYVANIDDSGQIVVYGARMIDWGLYRDYTYVLTPVPEPSAVVLAAGGLVFLLRFVRRRGTMFFTNRGNGD